MRLLVTGGLDGQLARSLNEAPASPSLDVVTAGPPQLDLLNSESVERTINAVRPNIVVNVGAYTAADAAEDEPQIVYAVNAEGPRYVAEMCERHGIPLIQISTDYVFDGTKGTPYVETDVPEPLNVYGRAKLAGERYVAAACTRHVILRTAWVYSPYGRNFVKTMLSLAASRSELRVVDDRMGCPTYAPHLAEAILQVAGAILSANSRTLWGTYHATGTGEATWCELAREVFRRSAEQGGPAAKVHGITSEEYPTRAIRPADSRLDCSKLQDTFGVRLPDWREGVALCVARLLGSDSRDAN
jgi:dTDP-4-dehydrorhamnose reductase